MNAVISAPRCPLYLRPELNCELADEALLGWAVSILDAPCPGWYQIKTDYGYTGFAPPAALVAGDENATRWAALDKQVVWRGICSVRHAPDVQSWEVAVLLRGACVAVQGQPDEKGWQKLLLPNGDTGYTKTGFLRPLPAAPREETVLREQVCRNAHLYMDAHYLWGGKTPMGIDCSGLTFMAYRLAGVTIWRDASIRAGYPIRAIDPADKQPGDLLFFPGHVALYLGEGRYIHSTAFDGSDGVVVNSLIPGAPDYRADLPEKLTAVGSLF